MRPLLLIAVILLGLGVGAVKLVEEPNLVATFAAAGFAPEVLSLFGALQLFSALLLVFRRTRAAAGLLLAASFAYSAHLILRQGDWSLAVFPLVLVPLTLAAAFWPRARRHS